MKHSIPTILFLSALAACGPQPVDPADAALAILLTPKSLAQIGAETELTCLHQQAAADTAFVTERHLGKSTNVLLATKSVSYRADAICDREPMTEIASSTQGLEVTDYTRTPILGSLLPRNLFTLTGEQTYLDHSYYVAADTCGRNYVSESEPTDVCGHD